MGNLDICTAHLSQEGLARAQAEQYAKSTDSKTENSACFDTTVKVIAVVAALFLVLVALVALKLQAALILALPIIAVGSVGVVYSNKIVFFFENYVFVPRGANSSYGGFTPPRGNNVPFGGSHYQTPPYRGNQRGHGFSQGRECRQPPPQFGGSGGNTSFGNRSSGPSFSQPSPQFRGSGGNTSFGNRSSGPSFSQPSPQFRGRGGHNVPFGNRSSGPSFGQQPPQFRGSGGHNVPFGSGHDQ